MTKNGPPRFFVLPRVDLPIPDYPNLDDWFSPPPRPSHNGADYRDFDVPLVIEVIKLLTTARAKGTRLSKTKACKLVSDNVDPRTTNVERLNIRKRLIRRLREPLFLSKLPPDVQQCWYTWAAGVE